MKTYDINYLINRLKSGQLTIDENKSLVGIIKGQIKYININFNLDSYEIQDLISEMISILLHTVNISKKEIRNPIAYIRTVLTNLIIHKEIAYNAISQLRYHVKKILEALEKEGKICSYNNRKFCLNGYRDSRFNKSDVLNLTALYNFSEINRELRWTERKIKLLSDFIMQFLEEIICVDFSTLLDFLKIKLGLKVINENINSESFPYDENSTDYNALDGLTFKQNFNEDELLLREIDDAYETLLRKFISANSEKNKKILCIIYYYEFENKSFKEIAEIFNYSSPTTIQNILINNSLLTPVEFLKSYSLLDEKVKNPFDFLCQINDRLLAKLKEIVDEFKGDFQ